MTEFIKLTSTCPDQGAIRLRRDAISSYVDVIFVPPDSKKQETLVRCDGMTYYVTETLAWLDDALSV
jgi:hypothetical protein